MKIKKIAKTLSTRTHALTVVLIVLALEQAIFAQTESVGLVGEYRAAPVQYRFIRGNKMIQFISGELDLHGEAVRNAPYSAEAITEVTQTFADGNHIRRTNTAVIYRDSEGRMRREQTLTSIGPWTLQGEPRQFILIHDPVSGVSYTLDPVAQVARKVRQPTFDVINGTGGRIDIRQVGPEGAAHDHNVHPETEPQIDWTALPGTVIPPADDMHQTEPMGTRTVEGVLVEGTRLTMTIPAGSIGNELPIEIVSTRWCSPQLKVLVEREHSDPRFGTTSSPW